MSNNKQSSVEYLVDQLLPKALTAEQYYHINQAKQMEKEHIIDAHVTGIIEPLIMKNYKGLSVDKIKVEITKQAEEYYKETFKSE